MTKVLYLAAGALIAGVTFAAVPASASSVPAVQSGVSQDMAQDLSARRRCRVIVERRWRHGHRVTIKRTVCRNYW